MHWGIGSNVLLPDHQKQSAYTLKHKVWLSLGCNSACLIAGGIINSYKITFSSAHMFILQHFKPPWPSYRVKMQQNEMKRNQITCLCHNPPWLPQGASIGSQRFSTHLVANDFPPPSRFLGFSQMYLWLFLSSLDRSSYVVKIVWNGRPHMKCYYCYNKPAMLLTMWRQTLVSSDS